MPPRKTPIRPPCRPHPRLAVVLGLVLAAAPAGRTAAEPVETGYRDFEYGASVISGPTAEKPESKLWWADGSWWGSLWNPGSLRYEIYRFDAGGHAWTTTGTAIDDRPGSLGDALWDGSKLYVVSHIYAKDAGPADTAANAARLYRYDYAPGSGSWNLDAGFPVIVNEWMTETLVLAKDTTGRLWATWTEDGNVMVNRSTTDDLTWGTPFRLPAQDDDAKSDDISSILAFNGDRIGVLWSDQDDDRFYFAVHRDGHGDLDWGARETAIVDPGGESIADDHINLATCDATGAVFAAVKTGMPDPEDPEILMLKREIDGTWSHATWSTDFDDHTRPVLVVNCETNTAYIFASATLTGHQEVIFMKATNLDTMEFPPGKGTPFIESEEDEDLNNPTSTKQPVTAESGLLVLASDKDTETYLHNFVDFGPTAPPVFFSALPMTGIPGEEIVIMGAGLAGATAVAFDGDPAEFTVPSSAEIRALVPAGAQIGRIRITTPHGFVESPEDFTVIHTPSVASYSPGDGPVGTEVVLGGDFFTGTASVTFGGVECESFSVETDEEVRAIVPAAAVTGPITITNPAGSATTDGDFVVIRPPGITGFDPDRGEAGDVVQITGTGFTGVTAVAFGGTPAAAFAVLDDTVVQAEVAVGTTTGPITVTNAAGSAQSASDFVYVQITGVDVAEPPGAFELMPNRPNPFHPSTEILYRTPRQTRIRISIFDVLGRRVATLVDGVRPAGRHAVRWDGRDSRGRPVASGVYVTELRAGEFVARRTMTVRR